MRKARRDHEEEDEKEGRGDGVWFFLEFVVFGMSGLFVVSFLLCLLTT